MTLVLLALFLLTLLLSSFFSSAEVTYFSLDPHEIQRIRQKHPEASDRIEALLQRPTALLSTLLIGNTVINIAATLLWYHIIAQWHWLPPGHHAWVAVCSMTLIILVFGEFGPKRAATLWTYPMAIRFAGPMHFCMRLTAPFRHMLESVTRVFEHSFLPESNQLTGEELGSLVDLSLESGILDAHERNMIQAVIQLEKLYASDIMTPRVDITAVDIDAPNLQEQLIQSKPRFVILYRNTLDDISGLVDVRTWLLDPERNLKTAIQAPFFVPEQATLDKVMALFLSEKKRVAIVVDEYGGTAGVLTRGDLLEELTGFALKDGRRDYLQEKLDDRTWLLDGDLHLEDIRKLIATDLTNEDGSSDRLAGWVSAQLAMLPRPGQSFEQNGYRFTVEQMRRNRVTVVRVQQINLQEDPS